MDIENIMTVGLIKNYRSFYTKKGAEMASLSLETRFGSIPAVVFPTVFQRIKLNLRDNIVIGALGNWKYDGRNEKYQFLINDVINDDALISTPVTPIIVPVENKAQQEKIISFVKSHPGNCPVRLSANGKEYPLSDSVEQTTEALEFLSFGYRQIV